MPALLLEVPETFAGAMFPVFARPQTFVFVGRFFINDHPLRLSLGSGIFKRRRVARALCLEVRGRDVLVVMMFTKAVFLVL